MVTYNIPTFYCFSFLLNNYRTILPHDSPVLAVCITNIGYVHHELALYYRCTSHAQPSSYVAQLLAPANQLQAELAGYICVLALWQMCSNLKLPIPASRYISCVLTKF